MTATTARQQLAERRSTPAGGSLVTNVVLATLRQVTFRLRVSLLINATNIGFVCNLDAVASKASGDWMLTLSSDGILLPGAHDSLRALVKHMGPDHREDFAVRRHVDFGKAANPHHLRRPPLAWATRLACFGGPPATALAPLAIPAATARLRKHDLSTASTDSFAETWHN